ncbi:hypothetical protein IAE35_08240 [Pseudomonas sp. S75]|uniref:hypothetical protein n=1 Tax=unclassified Pseudomonas TaxID=196821 RepID=UPI0019050BD9|nr:MULTISPECIES: hypothetical protein [unclassified Pseudomonas]MBJ9974550.1 hypothetical protein [Pseudomonas sp. S30]MBK0153329.1 hypothetical protein [Pseudomonas sp. S75]
MKLTQCSIALVAGLAVQAGAMASETIHTAHIGEDGTLLRQSGEWIREVKKTPLDNYYTEYKLMLAAGAFDKDPSFCSVSPIDASSADRQMHGQAKVIGIPTLAKVDVMTQLVDMQGPSGDNSLAFLLMCVH